MNTIIFACGAIYESHNIPTKKRLFVYAADGSVKSPTIDGKPSPCLKCPIKRSLSHRKESVGWVGKTESELDDKEPTRVVFCEPTAIL